MVNKKIAIIGAGHMGKAIASGFLRGKIIKRNNLLLSNGPDNIAAAQRAEIIIIAVKPTTVSIVAREIGDYLRKEVIIISSAACVTFDLLEKYFTQKKIVRIMPNLPVAYANGVVGWMGNKNIREKDEKLITKLLGNLGYLIKCKDENTLDKLTVISGSGPGYFSYIISKLEKSSQRFGFTEKESREIILQVIYGVICQLKSTSLSSKKLLNNVATRGGITEEIVNNLDKNNFYQLLFNSLKKGYDKIEAVKKELKNETI